MPDRRIGLRRHEATAPMVCTEGFAHALGPYSCSTIGDHRQFQTIATHFAEQFSQFFRSTTAPIEEDINTDQFLFLWNVIMRCHTLMCCLLRRIAVADGFEMPRLLTNALNNGSGELFRTHLFFTDIGLEDIIGMNAIFERTQPGIIDQCCYIRLTDMYQHQNSTQQKTRGVGEILARTPG